MSNRALVFVAVLQLALLVAVAFLLVDRLGRLRPLPAPSWTFRNPTLAVEQGARLVVQSQTGMEGATRWLVLEAVVEPDLQRPPGVPYRPMYREDWDDGEFALFRERNPLQHLILAQMGAMTEDEWIEEIRPVLQAGPDGPEQRTLAVFGHENGSTVVYVHDPEDPRPAFGWERMEFRPPDQAPRIHFARDVTDTAPR